MYLVISIIAITIQMICAKNDTFEEEKVQLSERIVHVFGNENSDRVSCFNHN